MAGQTVLAMEGVSVTLQTPNGALNAVHDIDLTLSRGEALGIVGESGSGKSMTALALMNLLPRNATRTAKTLRLLDHDLTRMPDAEFARTIAGQKVAMIFQEPMTSLNPVYPIGRQLTEGVVRAGVMTEGEARKRAIELLHRVKMPDPSGRLDQYPHQFSGGQRQRIMIAMALMAKPDLIIADEPTTALDVTVQAEILKLMAELQQDLGMAMILITHDLGVLAETVDRVAVMYAGEFVESGPVTDVLGRAQHPYTAALVKAAPEPDGARRRLAAIPGQIRPVYGGRRVCVFENRCPLSEAECGEAHPDIREAGQGHVYRCILPPDRTAAAVVPEPEVPAGPEIVDVPIITMSGVSRVFTTRQSVFRPRKQIRAVDRVDLSVRRGETFALVGESGSGKSTLARMLLGLDTPTEGTIEVNGTPAGALAGVNRAKLIQPIFQDPYSSLNPRRSIADIIAQPMSLHRIGTAAERRARVAATLKTVGLPQAFMHNYPSQLSGGQRQRVAIARALILNPEILICDEPTSALDVSVQAQILNLLADLKATTGMTLFIITHDIGVVHQIADRVAVMKSGRIVESGAADQVLGAPKDAYTRDLLSAVPSIKRTLKNRQREGVKDVE